MLKPLLISFLSENGGATASYYLVAGGASSFSDTESGESSDLESYFSEGIDSASSMDECGDTKQTTTEDAERHAAEERWREFEAKMNELDTTGTGKVLLGKLNCQWWGRIANWHL